jgi:hypothetical protein
MAFIDVLFSQIIRREIDIPDDVDMMRQHQHLKRQLVNNIWTTLLIPD